MSAAPILRGAGGGGKSGGGGGRTPSESPDTLRSRQYARVIDLVSEGEIEGLVDGLKSIYLDDTPLLAADGSANFQGVTVATRTGTAAQTYIPGFAVVESETAVGVEVKAATPVVRSFSGALDALRITVSVPQLTFQDLSTGDLSGTSVQLAVDINNNGGGWQQALLDTLSGKTTSKYQRAWRVPLPAPGPWDVRVRRITPDGTQANLQNKTYWDSVTTLVDAKLRYPLSALVAIELDASAFASVPTRAYDLKGLRVRVPANYTPASRAYSGIWDGTWQIAWTDNPAWIFHDLLTSERYGLGEFISATDVDPWALYEIAQYCDALVPDGRGGMEPRFTCNLYLQTRQEAYTVLQQMAGIFRAMVWWQQGAITAAQDRPDNPVALFTAANVIGGEFSYQGAAASARHTVALVSWNDPADGYRPAIEYVADDDGIARYGVRETEIAAIGCTSRGQAHRTGRWLLYSERLESETVTFGAALDAAGVQPGAVIALSDPFRSGQRMGGRLLAGSGTSHVLLDAPVTLQAGGSYTLSVVMPDGSVANTSVALMPGTTAALDLVTPLPAAPAPAAIWVLAAASLQPTLWRVISIEERDAQTVQVTALAHDPSKYAAIEQGIALQPRQTSVLDPRQPPPAPAGLTATESLYRAGPATVATRLTVSWQPVVGAARYALEWRAANGNPQRVESNACSVDLAPIAAGAYSLRLRAFTSLGVASASALLDVSVQGLAIPPGDVTGLTWTAEGYGIRLAWDAAGDLDLAGYELRAGADWASAAVITQVAATTYLWRVQAAGTQRVWIAAMDTTGHTSSTPAGVDVIITAPAAPVLSYALDAGDEVLSWTVPASSFAIDHYALRVGADWASATPLDTTKATSLRRRADYAGARTWQVAAVDAAGNVGTPAALSVQVTPPGAPTQLRAEVVDNNVLLRWQAPTSGDLPIAHYRLRKGADWASADPAAELSASAIFATVFEQSGGQYSYWIAAVDTAGTVGTPAGISATVAQPPDYILRTVINADLNLGTRSNAQLQNAALIMPVNTGESWQTHFQTHGWNTPQDQITAGYPLVAQPVPASATYTQEFDYGAVLPATMITVDTVVDLIYGSPAVSVQIDTRASTVDAWTPAPAGAMQALVINARYVRVTLTTTSPDGQGLARVSALTIKLSNKLRTDSGSGSISDAANGVFVPFNVSFLDANTPIVQPAGSTPLIPVVDFSDTPNPSGFTVYLYTPAGAKTTGSFSWTTRGY